MTKRRAESEIAKSEEPTRRVPSLSVEGGVLQVELKGEGDLRCVLPDVFEQLAG